VNHDSAINKHTFKPNVYAIASTYTGDPVRGQRRSGDGGNGVGAANGMWGAIALAEKATGVVEHGGERRSGCRWNHSAGKRF
jgi:hypothetical protein